MNYKFLAKNGLSLAFGLGLLGILATLIPVFSGLGAFNALPPDDVNLRSVSPESSIFQPGIYIAIVLSIIAFGLAILFGILSTAKNVKGSKAALISFALLVVLFIVFYATTSSELDPKTTELINKPDYHINGDVGLYKWISAGIDGTLVLFVIAFVTMVIMEIRNFFKNS